MNSRSRLSFMIIVTLILLTPMFAVAAESGARHQMPVLEGQSFAANVNAGGRPAIAVFNVTDEGMVSLYLYFPAENYLRVLYSVPAQVVRSDDTWDITVPARGVAFTLSKDRDEHVTVDGRPTKLKLVARGEIERLRVEKVEACAPAETSVDVAAAPTARPGHPQVRNDSAFNCILAGLFGGCCDSCFCVHRDLGLPEWADVICCGFSC